MTGMHTFSIIIPAYNYADYLGHALDSLLNQAYPQFEIIIVNDGSTDQTASVMQAYQEQHPDKIKCITQENKGAGGARNTGIREATGDYVIFLDADDRLLPQALSLFNHVFADHPSIDAVFAAHWVIRNETRRERHHAPHVDSRPHRNFVRLIKKDFPAPTGSYAIKRSALSQLAFSEKITNYEDGIFLAHLLSRCHILSHDEPVVEIHRHGGSLRSRIDPDKHDVNLVCDILFDKAYLPKELFIYRRYYQSMHLLRLFRRSILNHDDRTAKAYYHEAIRVYKPSLLQWRYLKKYLVMRFRRHL